MVYQYVREPLTAEDADKLCQACQTLQGKLIVWILLDPQVWNGLAGEAEPELEGAELSLGTFSGGLPRTLKCTS